MPCGLLAVVLVLATLLPACVLAVPPAVVEDAEALDDEHDDAIIASSIAREIVAVLRA